MRAFFDTNVLVAAARVADAPLVTFDGEPLDNGATAPGELLSEPR